MPCPNVIIVFSNRNIMVYYKVLKYSMVYYSILYYIMAHYNTIWRGVGEVWGFGV